MLLVIFFCLSFFILQLFLFLFSFSFFKCYLEIHICRAFKQHFFTVISMASDQKLCRLSAGLYIADDLSVVRCSDINLYHTGPEDSKWLLISRSRVIVCLSVCWLICRWRTDAEEGGWWTLTFGVVGRRSRAKNLPSCWSCKKSREKKKKKAAMDGALTTVVFD